MTPLTDQIGFYLRNWWHVISAMGVLAWLSIGWVAGVNAFMATGDRLTPKMADEVYVRKAVHEVQQEEILRELRRLNIWLKYYAKQQGIEIPEELFDE